MIKTTIKKNFLDGEQEVVFLGGNDFKLKRKLKRGDIVGIDFGVNIGREKSGIRPAVVISDISANMASENVIVAPTTAYVNKMRSDGSVGLLPSQFVLSRKFYRQLGKTSIVQMEDIRSVSKKRITGFFGDLSDRSMDELNDCVKRTLTF